MVIYNSLLNDYESSLNLTLKNIILLYHTYISEQKELLWGGKFGDFDVFQQKRFYMYLYVYEERV